MMALCCAPSEPSRRRPASSRSRARAGIDPPRLISQPIMAKTISKAFVCGRLMAAVSDSSTPRSDQREPSSGVLAASSTRRQASLPAVSKSASTRARAPISAIPASIV